MPVEAAPKFLPFLDEFTDKTLEDSYRRDFQPEAYRLFVLGCVLATIAYVSFSVNDFRLAATLQEGLFLAASRIVAVAGLALLVMLLRRVSTWIFDLGALCSLVVIGVAQLLIESTRPADYLSHIGLDVMFVVSIYLVVPIPLRLQAVAALCFSAGVMGVFLFLRPEADPLNSVSVPLSLVLANIIGAFGACRHARFRRMKFLLMQREQQTSNTLEQALAEVRTLSGLLCVCAWCRKIRDDKDQWVNMETYVAANTDASFSHGLCPECFERERDKVVARIT